MLAFVENSCLKGSGQRGKHLILVLDTVLLSLTRVYWSSIEDFVDIFIDAAKLSASSRYDTIDPFLESHKSSVLNH